MKQGPPQEPPTTPNLETEPILSFEDFSRKDKYGGRRFGNFWGCFAGGVLGNAYRKQEHYKRFAREYPEMAASLRTRIQNSYKIKEEPESLVRALYEAYKIMRSYGFSDEVLFS